MAGSRYISNARTPLSIDEPLQNQQHAVLTPAHSARWKRVLLMTRVKGGDHGSEDERFGHCSYHSSDYDCVLEITRSSAAGRGTARRAKSADILSTAAYRSRPHVTTMTSWYFRSSFGPRRRLLSERQSRQESCLQTYFRTTYTITK